MNSYTVYLDLGIVDQNGIVVACGRPGQYPRAAGGHFGKTPWFRAAVQTRSGEKYAVGQMRYVGGLNWQAAAIYATAICESGRLNGKILGMLGIAFD